MADPIDPTFEEDVVHVDQTKPRIDLPVSNKKEAAGDAFKRRIEREQKELAAILALPAGEAFIMRILHQCHIYYDGKLTDEAQGRRQLGVKLIKEIAAIGPENYPNLLANHAKRAQSIKDAEAAVTDK